MWYLTLFDNVWNVSYCIINFKCHQTYSNIIKVLSFCCQDNEYSQAAVSRCNEALALFGADEASEAVLILEDVKQRDPSIAEAGSTWETCQVTENWSSNMLEHRKFELKSIVRLVIKKRYLKCSEDHWTPQQISFVYHSDMTWHDWVALDGFGVTVMVQLYLRMHMLLLRFPTGLQRTIRRPKMNGEWRVKTLILAAGEGRSGGQDVEWCHSLVIFGHEMILDPSSSILIHPHPSSSILHSSRQYKDNDWVKDIRRWPPQLVEKLSRFLRRETAWVGRLGGAKCVENRGHVSHGVTYNDHPGPSKNGPYAKKSTARMIWCATCCYSAVLTPRTWQILTILWKVKKWLGKRCCEASLWPSLL